MNSRRQRERGRERERDHSESSVGGGGGGMIRSDLEIIGERQRGEEEITV